MAEKLFISYRREDSAPYAGRLSDYLCGIVGEDRVFMDVEDIEPGHNFAETIDRSIAGCDTALIVIGPRWTNVLRERLQAHEQDYVCHEVASAIAQKLRIVPVLVGGAPMPAETDLPAPLKTLSLHQAFEVRDAAFRQDCERLSRHLALARPWKRWVSVVAIIVVAVLIAGGLWSLRTPPVPPDPRLATARTQTELGQHESAFRTYGAVLKDQPANASVMDLQADAAMEWTREFRALIREDQKPEEVAGPPLAEIINALEAALARTGGKGARAGDVLAHLGWAHWLNRHIAQKEFGDAAEKTLRQALTVDPSNVYAHAMLGSWMLQNRRDTAEALRHLEAAETSGQHRAFVRRLELGAMIYNWQDGVPAALMRLLNRMRIDGATLSEGERSRATAWFRPGNEKQLPEMLNAVPPAEVWATFEWLNQPPAPFDEYRSGYIHARVLELEGKSSEALAILTGLEKKMQAEQRFGRALDDISEAAKRIRALPQ